MYIKSVALKNYRNYSSARVEFSKGLNIVVGKNAAGKTNLVESIYCSALGKSPRSNKYKDLIKWNESSCYIKVVVAKKYRDYTIEFGIDNTDKKRVAVDGVPLTRLSGLVGILNVVFFSPDEIKLIKEKLGESPILLLDDVLAELDDLRQNYLLTTIEDDTQTIITSVDTLLFDESFLNDVKIHSIKNGQLN